MKRILFALLLFAIALPIQAQQRWDELQFPELKSFNKPDVTTFTLKNGIKVYMLEDHELPLITLSALVRTGSILEQPDKYGLASITGTVMRTGGTAKYPTENLDVLLEDKAAYLSTGIGFSSGSANLNTLKEDFAELLPVFVDVITNPAFPDEKIELARRQMKTGISRRNDDPQSVASREFNKLIYGHESIYAKQTEYATLDNITRDDMVAFHRKSFVGSNMMVSVIGDFKTADMRKLIEKHLSDIPKGQPLSLEFPDVEPGETSVNVVDKKGNQQSVVFLGHEGGLRQDPDYAALQVLNQVLSGGFSSRLFKKVRTDLGLAYAVFADYGSNLNYKGTFYAGVMTKTETTAQAIDAIKEEIARLQEEPVSEEELNRVKDQFLNSLAFRYTSLGSVLGERVSYEYNGLPADLFDRFIDDVKKVSPADLQRVAKEKIRPDDMTILVVGDKAGIGNQLDKYGTVREIDIAIPEPKSDRREETTGDVEGQAWLNRMADAVVAPGTNFRGIKTTGRLAQGPMSAEMETTIIFPNEMSTLIKSAMGTLEQSYKDGKAMIRAGEAEQDLGEAGAAEIQTNLDTHYIGVAIRKSQLRASFLGMDTMDGKQYAKIEVNAGPGVIFWIDTETSLPARMDVTRYIPQAGAEVTISTIYSDWNTKDGIQIAFNSKQTMDGSPSGEVLITAFEVVR